MTAATSGHPSTSPSAGRRSPASSVRGMAGRSCHGRLFDLGHDDHDRTGTTGPEHLSPASRLGSAGDGDRLTLGVGNKMMRPDQARAESSWDGRNLEVPRERG